MRRYLTCTLVAVTLMQTSACGYFLYPERVGRHSGQIDPTIVILDAAALLFGVLPGVVAFAVDFTTGAIFLSPGEKSAVEKHSGSFGLAADSDMAPVARSEVEAVSDRLAGTLSALLGRPVDAADIEFYRAGGGGPVVLAGWLPAGT
jgi:hypothetical protein